LLQTGTGKTAAILLPILNKLSEGGHPEDAINCVIMSPTRELAQQIDQQMEGFSYFMSRNAAVLPVPVCATAIKSLPSSMIGIACFCIGVDGVLYFLGFKDSYLNM